MNKVAFSELIQKEIDNDHDRLLALRGYDLYGTLSKHNQGILTLVVKTSSDLATIFDIQKIQVMVFTESAISLLSINKDFSKFDRDDKLGMVFYRLVIMTCIEKGRKVFREFSDN